MSSFASGDPEQIAAWVSSDFANEHTAVLGSSSTGRDEYRRRLPRFLADFAGLRYEIEDALADGDRVVVAYRLRATFQGHELDIPGVFRLWVQDGRVTRRVDYWDSGQFLHQTGQG